MKKKKRFQLHRETLRRLDADRLGQVAGGGETFEIQTTCACTDGCGGSGGCGSNDGCGTGGCGSDTCTCIQPESFCHCP